MFSKFRKAMNTNNQETQDQNKAENTSEARDAEEQLAQALNTDDSVSGMQHLDAESMLAEDSEVDQLNEELEESKNKYLRLMAEFDTARRRFAKERLEMSATAGREVIQSLLVVLDDTERASRQLEASEDIQAIREGVMLVFNKLRNTLHNLGLRKMESVNHPFDADLHEAITEIPAPDMEGKVIDETEPGYYLNDKLIRHAKVIVGK
jgi:molecular chaperone GrpE